MTTTPELRGTRRESVADVLAPEMLTALEFIECVYRRNCVTEGDESSVLDELQRIIAKATACGIGVPEPLPEVLINDKLNDLAPGLSDPEAARETLVHALMASKSWMRGYAEAFVDDYAEQPAHTALDSNGEYWLSIRTKVIAALAEAGFKILSDKDRVWLHQVAGVRRPAEPT